MKRSRKARRRRPMTALQRKYFGGGGHKKTSTRRRRRSATSHRQESTPVAHKKRRRRKSRRSNPFVNARKSSSGRKSGRRRRSHGGRGSGGSGSSLIFNPKQPVQSITTIAIAGGCGATAAAGGNYVMDKVLEKVDPDNKSGLANAGYGRAAVTSGVGLPAGWGAYKVTKSPAVGVGVTLGFVIQGMMIGVNKFRADRARDKAAADRAAAAAGSPQGQAGLGRYPLPPRQLPVRRMTSTAPAKRVVMVAGGQNFGSAN